MYCDLSLPIQFVKGVGPSRAKMFEAAGLSTAEDLLRYRPFRYEDRTNFRQIRDVQAMEECVIRGEIAVAGGYSTSRAKMKIYEMLVRDASGAIPVKFFNQPYLSKVLIEGREVIVYGVPRHDSYRGGLAFLNPEVELVFAESDSTVHTGRIVPVYRKVGQVSTRGIRQILWNLISNLAPDLPDPLPEELRKRWDFPDLATALRGLHFPEMTQSVGREEFLRRLESLETASQRRFVFEEFFLFQAGLMLTRRKIESQPKTHRIQITDEVRNRIKSILPFHPTDAQKRVLKEIVDDLVSERVMSRLLQGDVGSGKTLVALQAMTVVIENGFQAALMAPTELLAEQHFRTLTRYLSSSPYRVAYLTSSVKGKDRRKVLTEVESGEADLIVGTHALIQDKVRFPRLAMVVIDEQHRFGVIQRSELMKKGEMPDTLVMTATPIPRSLALTVYGDLSVSILDQMPPGRQPVKTVIKAEKSRPEVYRLLLEEVGRGRQVFIVYPLVEESEKVDLKAASEMAESLKKSVFRDSSVGLLHGRMKAAEKEALMREFSEGRLSVLVATTVVEVGIDVPNATVMVIEHAERFGLSQLHQLRGRIGRGRHAGLCVLMVDKVKTKEAFGRLDIMRKTNDGFRIAEKDLEIRGPGEFVGVKQSGVPQFLFGNLVRDRKLLELARREAEEHVGRLYLETDQKGIADLVRIIRQWRERYGLFQVG